MSLPTMRPNRVPRAVVAVLAMLALLATSCGGSTDTTDTATVADAAPAASSDSAAIDDGPAAFPVSAVVPTVAGGQIDFGSLAGQDVVLWFWAPW